MSLFFFLCINCWLFHTLGLRVGIVYLILDWDESDLYICNRKSSKFSFLIDMISNMGVILIDDRCIQLIRCI